MVGLIGQEFHQNVPSRYNSIFTFTGQSLSEQIALSGFILRNTCHKNSSFNVSDTKFDGCQHQSQACSSLCQASDSPLGCDRMQSQPTSAYTSSVSKQVEVSLPKCLFDFFDLPELSFLVSSSLTCISCFSKQLVS